MGAGWLSVQDSEQYRLTIDSWSPETIPMERLAAYMAEFARVLGEAQSVHFVQVEPGSARLAAAVDGTSTPKVEDRMLRVRSGDPPDDGAKRGLRNLDEMMRADKAIGSITGPDSVLYVDFQGRGRPKPVTFGPFKERHSLDGTVIKIGGTDSTIPVWLQDGDRPPQICEASVETSKRLAPYYRLGVIRAHGTGTWMRSDDGAWQMRKFRIEEFDVLDESPLGDVIERLHAVGGSHWHEIEDPVGEALRLRHES